MPIEQKQDNQGPYYHVYNTNSKFRYISGNKRSRNIAYNKALQQLVAIKINQLRS